MKFLLLAVGALCLVATSASAEQPKRRARSSLKLEMFVLHATTRGAGFDRRLPPKMKRKLRQPPYSAYSTYKLLSRKAAKLSFVRPLEVNLPDGSVLRLSAKPSGGKRFRFTAEIKRKGGKFEPALRAHARAGKLLLISGRKHQHGVLFVGVRLPAR